MDDFSEQLKFLIKSGPLDAGRRGYLLSKWIKQIRGVSTELSNMGRFFPLQFQRDLDFFKRETSKSATFQKNYVIEVKKLQNNGIYNEELVNKIHEPFTEIKGHLDNLVSNFLDFIKLYGFRIENENVIVEEQQEQKEIQSFAQKQEQGQGQDEIQGLAHEQKEKLEMPILVPQIVNENETVALIDEQIQEIEPVNLIRDTQTQFIRLDFPLDFFNFHGVSLYSFQYCGNTTSIGFKPELQVGYSNNGWFVNVNCDVKFNFSNIFQPKSPNLVAICLKQGNYMGKISYFSANKKSGYNFSLTHHMTAIQKSDINWTLNLSAQDTRFELLSTSVEIEVSPHIGIVNKYFASHPICSYKVYPFWETHVSSCSDSSSIQEIEVEMEDSTTSEIEVPDRSKMISMDNYQPYTLEPEPNYSNTISKPVLNFTKTSVILLSFFAIGFMIKKLFSKKK